MVMVPDPPHPLVLEANVRCRPDSHHTAQKVIALGLLANLYFQEIRRGTVC
ncbi:MAG: hypothetical protein OEW44_07855 [Gemmatimonadota bacterium]|jgi:hypothetical protein|nr:hypothetical protein [Gemmatimonadota bacterium]